MQLLGGQVYMHQYKVNAKAAFDGEVWQWHQDYGVWQRDDEMPEPRAMNIAVFLEEVTAANGPLLFIPKSHKRGVFEAGHDLEGTSYPLWTLDRETVARLADEGGIVGADRTAGGRRAVSWQSGARQPAEHQPVAARHRVSQPVRGEQPHPPIQAPRVYRPPGFHAPSNLSRTTACWSWLSRRAPSPPWDSHEPEPTSAAAIAGQGTRACRPDRCRQVRLDVSVAGADHPRGWRSASLPTSTPSGRGTSVPRSAGSRSALRALASWKMAVR